LNLYISVYNSYNSQAGDKFIEDVMNRIKSTVILEDAAKQTDLVIEAIVENMKIKHKLFSELDKIAPK
jgi:3-hydroxyacyl-CoA dehydrogenase